MSEVNINYKGSTIASMDASGTKTLQTSGKYCEDDVEVVYTRPTAPTPTYQTKSVTPSESAQTVTADSGYDALEEVDVGAISSTYVGSGITRRSSADLTASNLTVTAPSGYYASNATKTLSDANLVAENVKKDVTIFNVTGSYEGGGISGVATGTLTVASDVSTSKKVTIVSTDEIGFIPTKFLFYKDENTQTNKCIRMATYAQLGTKYVRTRSIYSTQDTVCVTAANYTDWTASSSGYLYMDSGNIQISVSSSYILKAGTYTWWAME